MSSAITMSSAHSQTFSSLHLRHNSFSNPSVALPTSLLIFQPFCCFTYITVHSPTLLSLLLRHKLFTYRSAPDEASMLFAWLHRKQSLVVTLWPSCKWTQKKNNVQASSRNGRVQHAMWWYFVRSGEAVFPDTSSYGKFNLPGLHCKPSKSGNRNLYTLCIMQPIVIRHSRL